MRKTLCSVWAAMVGLGLVIPMWVQGQESAEVPLELDWRALILEPGVLDPNPSDPVWTLEPRPGRVQVMVPFKVLASEAAVELRSPGVDLRGGQFQAWYIPEPEVEEVSSQGGRDQGPASALGGLGGGLGGGFGDPAGGGFAGGLNAQGGQGARGGVQGLAVPRLAKSIVVEPGGVVRWEMDRVIVGAALSGSGESGYLLKLDPAAMRDRRPTPPERGRAGQGVDRQQQREQMAQFRAEMSAYNELRDQLKDLPESFEAEPGRVWAIYSLSERDDRLEFSGLADAAGGSNSGAWGIDLTDLEVLRARASGSGSQQAEADPGLAARLVNSGHPMGMRVLALAEARSGTMQQLESADVRVMSGVQAMLRMNDEPTRQIVVEAIANGETIGPRSTELLREAARDPSAEVRLTAMTGLLRGDPSGPGLAAAVADMLTSGEVSAVTVLERVAEQADAAIAGRSRGVEGSEQAWGTLVGVLPVGQAAAGDEAVVGYVVSAASESPAARRWLSGLLGAEDEGVRSAVIAALGQWPAEREPLVLGAADEPLVGMLESGDAGAWTALGAFAPGQADGRGRSNRFEGGFAGGGLGGGGLGGEGFGAEDVEVEQEGEGASRSVVDRVLAAAVAMTPTPMEAVGFVSRASDEQAANAGLLVLAGEGSGPAAADATRRVVQGRSSFAQVLNAVEAERRGVLVSGLYRSLGQEPPAAVMLLGAAEAGGELVRWLGERVDRGVLPDAAAWSEAFTTDEAVLGYVLDEDPEVVVAAWSVLAVRAGGEASLGEAIYDDMVVHQIEDAGAAGVFWEGWKERINAEQIGARSGSYRLGVELADRREGASKAANLGLIELCEEGGRLRVRGEGLTVEPGERPLSLVLTNPAELETMAPDGPTVLPGTRWPERIVLSSRGDGWVGEERAGMWVVRVRLEWVG